MMDWKTIPTVAINSGFIKILILNENFNSKVWHTKETDYPKSVQLC